MEYEKGAELHNILLAWLADYNFQLTTDDFTPMCKVFRNVCSVSADNTAFLQQWFALQVKRSRKGERCPLTVFTSHRLMFPEIRVLIVQDSADAEVVKSLERARRPNRV
jgi:hypothetical protein